jgi:hypothetical protein
MTCLKYKHHEANRSGFYGCNKILYRCPGCKARSGERIRKWLAKRIRSPPSQQHTFVASIYTHDPLTLP